MATELMPLTEAVERILAETEADIVRNADWQRANARRKIERIEQNRQAMCLLNTSGVELEHGRLGEWVTIRLGFFPDTKAGNTALAARVRQVRDALGCRLKQGGKDLVEEDTDKKKTRRRPRVELTLIPVDFPTVSVRFIRVLPAKAKCKVVKETNTYHRLVCGTGV